MMKRCETFCSKLNSLTVLRCIFFILLLYSSYTSSAQSLALDRDSIPPTFLSVDSLSINQDSILRADSIRMAREAMLAVKDSIRAEQRKKFTFVDTTPFKDSLSIYYWRISENLGEFRVAEPDTALTGFPKRRFVEGMGNSTATAYLGNLGTPAMARAYMDRKVSSNFMFADAYRVYNREPDNFIFINTRVPYSKIEYETEGSGETKSERFNAGISVNMNKKLNWGFDINYLYSRGRYASQGAKHVDLVLYSSYFSDRYRYHFFYNNRSFVNGENGGVLDDRYITTPDAIGQTQNMRSRDIPTLYRNTWNRIRGSRFFYTHRYNLGFDRPTGRVDEEGEDINQFIAVGSIIHTADLYVQNRRFVSEDRGLDTLYMNRYLDMDTSDTTRTWNFKNTVGLSLREGFASWSKFDLTAYAAFDYRQYLLMEKVPTAWVQSQTSTYLGGELSQNTGRMFRYSAKAEFGVLGENVGDVDLSGQLETRIPVLKDTASLVLNAFIKNTTPSFYEKHYHSKFFWWDNDGFIQTQRVHMGGTLHIPHTKSKLRLAVENISNYIYFDNQALPQQYDNSIQVIDARWEQNLKLGVLHWDNQFIYQLSGNKKIMPLPDFSLYSNLYLDIQALPVLRMQLGADMHYFTEYYSPTYEAAIQQFHTQNNVKVGNFPFVNAYLNCRLHQVRFFINYYNIGASFIKNADYFSLPHYPVSPMVMKMGISIDFKN